MYILSFKVKFKFIFRAYLKQQKLTKVQYIQSLNVLKASEWRPVKEKCDHVYVTFLVV